MKTTAAIAVCFLLNGICGQLAIAGDEPVVGSAASTQGSSTKGDDLHFVTVLTLRGEVATVDPANRLVILKSSTGNASTLEAMSAKDLEPLHVGDPVVVQYFEGARIGRRNSGEATTVPSLNDGLIGVGKKRALVASVEAVDAENQEVTLKAPDGTIETIMVTDPGYLEHIKAGDQVVITNAQALALSLKKEKP